MKKFKAFLKELLSYTAACVFGFLSGAAVILIVVLAHGIAQLASAL